MHSAQVLIFHTGTAVRVTAEVFEDPAGLRIEVAYNPPRHDEPIVAPDADSAADDLHRRLTEHLVEHGTRLWQITMRKADAPLTQSHIGRFGVSMIPAD